MHWWAGYVILPLCSDTGSLLHSWILNHQLARKLFRTLGNFLIYFLHDKLLRICNKFHRLDGRNLSLCLAPFIWYQQYITQYCNLWSVSYEPSFLGNVIIANVWSIWIISGRKCSRLFIGGILWNNFYVIGCRYAGLWYFNLFYSSYY